MIFGGQKGLFGGQKGLFGGQKGLNTYCYLDEISFTLLKSRVCSIRSDHH